MHLGESECFGHFLPGFPDPKQSPTVEERKSVDCDLTKSMTCTQMYIYICILQNMWVYIYIHTYKSYIYECMDHVCIKISRRHCLFVPRIHKGRQPQHLKSWHVSLFHIHQQTMPGRWFIKQPTNIEAWLINQTPLAYTTPEIRPNIIKGLSTRGFPW